MVYIGCSRLIIRILLNLPAPMRIPTCETVEDIIINTAIVSFLYTDIIFLNKATRCDAARCDCHVHAWRLYCASVKLRYNKHYSFMAVANVRQRRQLPLIFFWVQFICGCRRGLV